jgi:hypothetical protein
LHKTRQQANSFHICAHPSTVWTRPCSSVREGGAGTVNVIVLITVAARCNAPMNPGIVGSNRTQGMDVCTCMCVYSVSVLFCV